MPNHAQKLAGALLAILAPCLLAQTARADLVNYELVTVGDPGSRNSIYFYGAVDTDYQIGKYEVTIAQYTNFLNSVASLDDPYGLYSPRMANDLNSAGITRTGTTGSYVYSVMDNSGYSGNRPITYVSWYDAARFANWMSNSQTSGTTTTENGAYTLNGQTSGTAPTANSINPNTGEAPTFTLPSEDQWYKAAYYSPTLNGGLGGYYQYATQSSTEDPGNVIGSDPGQINYIVQPSGFLSVTQDATLYPTQNYLSDVGAFTNSASYYGTYDQNGNVWEIMDSAYDDTRALLTARGGGWTSYDSYLWDSYRLGVPASGETANGGFRLAAPIPEPSTYALLALALSLGIFLRKRLAPSSLTVAIVLFGTLAHRAQADLVNYSFVTVGNTGNAEDPLTGLGAVNYDYQIGQYDVTIAQYTSFLNAVAAIDDPNSLYHQEMATAGNIAGIMRSGTTGSYSYSVMDNSGYSGNRPITFVNWYDAARFANWISNGQPIGTQTTATTENGAYNLTIPSVSLGFAPPKNLVNPNTGDAPTAVLPTLDEFYKAAFYNLNVDGNGTPGYFKFATQSNSNPSNSNPDSTNGANIYAGTFAVTQSSAYSSAQNYLTDVGYYHNSPSFYGTFDQGGDVYQWNDLDGTLNSLRGMMGGFWFGGPTSASSTTFNSQATTYAGNDVGFRLAAPIPEPGTCALLGLAIAGYFVVRRRPPAPSR